MPLTRTWDQTELVVVIVPPLLYNDFEIRPLDTPFLRDVKNSIEAWQTAIDNHGSADLAGVVSFDARVVVFDDLGPEELAQADIVIASQRINGPFFASGGTAIEANAGPCIITNTPPASGGWTYRIAIHEFGHCLGLGHPDAFPEEPEPCSVPSEEIAGTVGPCVARPDAFAPEQDIMTYAKAAHCVSNLDLLGLHESFGPAFGRVGPPAVGLPAADYQVFC